MILNYINQFDYTLSTWAVGLTQASSWARLLVYISAEMLIWGFALYLIYAWATGRVGSKKMVLIAVMSLVLGTFIKTAINFLMFRERPFVAHPELLTFSFHVDAASFPSGHATIAFAVAVSLFLSLKSHKKNKIKWVFLIMAFLIALARYFAGVHYFSDVVVGALIGSLSAWYLHSEVSTLKKYLPNN